jgi:DNA-directed RNA polymerase sigma subunit (sigma70/sigma32)
MKRDKLIAALFPPGNQVKKRSKEELLQQLEDSATRLHEQTEKVLSTLTEKERRVLALRFAGERPEGETEPGEKGEGGEDQP